MILDLEKFIAEQQGVWRELDGLLGILERDAGAGMDLEKIKHFHHLYQRTSADLGKLQSFACEPELRLYLESLVARGFGEIHDTASRVRRLRLGSWLFRSFPQAFRRRLNAFWLALAAMLIGAVFGAALLHIDNDAKEIILPFHHLLGSPSERVAKEELAPNKTLEERKVLFSSELMTNNIRVAILCLAMGITFGVGTLILLFYNGVILGGVIFDYLRAGEASFLVGWLLPHGSVEIPAFLIAGQAGLVLAGAMLGRKAGIPMSERLRNVSSDLATLVGGTAIMLVWAGIIEAFFSQYHQPALPYSLKIGFGAVELIVLILFLGRCGSKTRETNSPR
ncbi:MAG: stage II sporulation protein M [Syntrophobacteraceae bacterium]